jgi:ribosome-associated protein
VTGQPDLPVSREGAEPAVQNFVEFVCTVLEEKRAADIVWLDVRGLTDLADDFVIATVLNPRQGAAIVDACEKERKRRGVTRLGIEGETGSSWVLMDYGDLIVHLFLPEQRAYYGLEHIWADAKRVR